MRTFTISLSMATLFLAGPALAQTVIYVDDTAAGANNGSSWTDAYVELQSALNAAGAEDEIHIAAGTYLPDYDVNTQTHTGNRYATFQLITGVALYGGFPDGGSSPEHRNPVAHETVLTGDLAANDGPDFENNDENSYHIVTGSYTDSTAILEGFTIIAGNAALDDQKYYVGAGMFIEYGSPTVRHCQIQENHAWAGAGVAVFGGTPLFSHCTLLNNHAAAELLPRGGGGMLMWESSPTITNCSFIRNSVAQSPGLATGGAIYCREDCSPTIANCTFIENLAGPDGSQALGGAIYCEWCRENEGVTVTNCSFIRNRAYGTEGSGGALKVLLSDATVTNSVFVENSTNGSGSFSFGGAIHLRSGTFDSLIMRNCSFIGNLAISDNDEYGDGGAIFTQSSGPVEITNCTLVANAANARGGGIFHRFSYGAAASIINNCILWGNVDTDGIDESAQIFVAASDVPPNYSCIQGWTGTLGGTGNIGDDPVAHDPRFVDPAGPDGTPGTEDDDLHILPDSPCINTGDPAGDYTGQTDIDNQPRVAYGQIDMGADEFVWTGDLDLDQDVDGQDFITFAICYNASMQPPQPNCQAPWADIDNDGDVDGHDFITFSTCYNGPLNPPRCP